MVTSRDVARIAGVSQATVSRIMNNRGSFSEETKKRVAEAMDSLGYVPHAGAQAMKTSRTGSVGIVVADMANPFYTEVVANMITLLNDAGYRALVWVSVEQGNPSAIQAIQEKRIDGVVFTTATYHSAELSEAVRNGSHIVLVNRYVENVPCDRVITDNQRGGHIIGSLLAKHQRDQVLFVGGHSSLSTARDRLAGTRCGLAEGSINLMQVIETDYSFEMAERLVDEFLGEGHRPTAIVCANDLSAFASLGLLKKYGISSEECWVIGYDGNPMSAWPLISLTTIRQPVEEMAKSAVDSLLNRIENPGSPIRNVEFPPELFVRDSTPGLDPSVLSLEDSPLKSQSN